MSDIPRLSALSLPSSMNHFNIEVESFKRDVHLLIFGTLRAAKSSLEAEVKEDDARIRAVMETASGDFHERLIDEPGDVHGYFADQERFLLNMALVALATSLTHTLRQMSRLADTFSPRKGRYAGGDKSEFERLWIEFRERFGIEVRAQTERIAFIDPFREVRNQIVHDGGIANPYKLLMDVQDVGSRPDERAITFDFDDLLDLRFSQAYPHFVQGEGSSAKVRVTQEQLQSMTSSAIELVEWCAEQLRERELEVATADDEANSDKSSF
jgi:hypothetical protein